MNLTASGASVSSGIGAVTGITPPYLSASGASLSSGSSVVTTAQPLGSMCDFGTWPSWMPDPAMSLVQSVGAPEGNGRMALSATVPTSYQTALGTLWNAAAYAAVAGTWQHTATNTALTQVQIEMLPGVNLLPPDAADYRDRMLYTQGSSTTGGVTTWDAAVERVSGHALSGDWCAQLTNSGGLSPYSMAPLPSALFPVVAGTTYQGKVSLAIARAGASWGAKLLWFDANFNPVGTTSGGATTHPGGLAYQQAVVRGVASGVYGAVVPFVTPAAVGDGEVAYADCHRVTTLTPRLTSAPSPWQPARQQNITIRANRVNYAVNPSFAQDIGGWYGQGGTTGTPAAWDGTVGRSLPGSLKVSVPYVAASPPPMCGSYPVGATGSGVLAGISAGRSGHTYTLSAYVLPLAGIPPVRMYVQIGGTNGLTVPGTTTAEVSPDAQGFYRLSATVTVPQSMAGSLAVMLQVSPTDWAAHAATVGWWVDDVLVEESPLLGTYFDAALASPDYLWEGTAFRSRSHYYQNLRFLQYRLSALVEDALPAGVPYQILLAQPDS